MFDAMVRRQSRQLFVGILADKADFRLRLEQQAHLGRRLGARPDHEHDAAG